VRNRVKIQNLIDTKMEEFIPGWSSLTPTDPLKVFSEGIVCALSEIDNQSKNTVGHMLDMIPTILSFYPKKPSLVKGLFHFDMKENGNKQLKIPKGLKLKYKANDGQTNYILFDEQKIEPYQITSQKRTENKLTLEFKVFGKIDALSLFFIRSEKKFKNSQLQEVKVKVKLSDQEHFFDNNGLAIKDSTLGLTKTGQIKLSPIDFDFPDQTYTITVELCNLEKANQGQILTNLAIGNICKIESETNLGVLNGEIWEEVKLPENIISPPQKIHIELPTGEYFDLKLAENDILKLKEFDSQAYINSYLYNGIQHTLTVPNAEVLLRNKLCGAEIKAKNLIYTVKESMFPNQESKIILDGLEETIKKVTPITIISPVMERERKDQFLSRFYRTLNQFYGYATNSASSFSEDEIKTNILNFDQNVRAIELKTDDINDVLYIYILSFNPFLYPDHQIDQKIINKVQIHAEQFTPLDKRLLVAPFKNKNINVEISLKLRVYSHNQDTIDRSNLESQLEKTCADFMLPWPFGRMKTKHKYSISEFQKFVKGSLGIKEEDIEDFSLTLLDCDTLIHLEELKREEGECLIPMINLHLDFDDTEAKDEEIILSSNSIDILDDDEVFDVFD